MKKVTNTAWITAYLQKKGKNLETLATSLGRATKKVIIERASEIGVDLAPIYTKNEMVSMILSKLEDDGYRFEAKAIPEKKAEEKKEAEAEYNDPFFKSEAAKKIFYLIYGSGTARTEVLGINEELYRDPAKAREWRNSLVKLIHPDGCNHPMAGEATREVTRIYNRMIAR